MCSRCWQRHPQRPFVQGEHLAARLDNPPAWLDNFVAHVAEVYSPSRACNVITALARLLVDEQPNHPQALPDRGRRPGALVGPAARSVETFFAERAAKPTLRHARKAPRGEVKLYPGGHIDFYLCEGFERAVTAQINFLHTHVPASTSSASNNTTVTRANKTAR